MNVTLRFVPATVAVTVTSPGDEPSVTCVFACPLASVTAVVGLTVALPVATANVTVAPCTGFPLELTRTTSGLVSAVPISWTWPFPATMSTADGPEVLGSELPPPHAATAIAVHSETVPRMRRANMHPPKGVDRDTDH